LHARLKAAWWATRDEPEGAPSLAGLVEISFLREAEQLEQLYNEGEPFPPAPARAQGASRPTTGDTGTRPTTCRSRCTRGSRLRGGRRAMSRRARRRWRGWWRSRSCVRRSSSSSSTTRASRSRRHPPAPGDQPRGRAAPGRVASGRVGTPPEHHPYRRAGLSEHAASRHVALPVQRRRRPG
jgi:hypothetical protein